MAFNVKVLEAFLPLANNFKDVALKQFEAEGLSSFLKNALYDILDTSEGRNYLRAKNISFIYSI